MNWDASLQLQQVSQYFQLGPNAFMTTAEAISATLVQFI